MIKLIKEKINNGVTELFFSIPDTEIHSYVVKTKVNGQESGIVYENIRNNLSFSITNNSNSRLNVSVRVEENDQQVFYGKTRVMPYVEPVRETTIKGDLEFDTDQISKYAAELFR